MIRNRSVLVTGGAGFIGSHLSERLAENNEVTVIDSLRTGQKENVPSDVEFVEGDITDRELVERTLPGHDVVVHMAALVGVQRTLNHPVEVLETNIEGTRTLLQVASEHEIDRFLLASTSEVYGDGINVPYQENNRSSPKTDYAVAKLADERFVRAYAEEYDFNYTTIRYFNVYGPGQDSSSYGYVVPIFIRQALAGDTLEVHGDGEQTRDFTYIDDAVRATVAALSEAGRNETFNVGSNIETTISELAEMITDVVGAGEVKYIDHPRPYTVKRRLADISKSQATLGYEPMYSLRDGIEELAGALSAPSAASTATDD